MSTVALIGPDGSGKTTLARRLVESAPRPMKYLYMGQCTLSSNITLPTSRLILYWKLRSHRRRLLRSGLAMPTDISGYELDRSQGERGKLAATARLLHRLLEEWYRQSISWAYQLRGYVVLYDRHFVFEYAPQKLNARERPLRLTDRLHLWMLHRLYPQPDLVLFLDAPPEVLMERKNECDLARLREDRDAYIEQGRSNPNFVRIDASQPVDKVFEEAHRILTKFEARGRPRTEEQRQVITGKQ